MTATSSVNRQQQNILQIVNPYPSNSDSIKVKDTSQLYDITIKMIDNDNNNFKSIKKGNDE